MEQQEWSRIFQLKAKNLKQGDSWRLEFDEKLVPDHPNSGWEQYSRNVFGRFKCTDCGRAWPSSRAMVVFHMQLTDGQGVVKVRPCRQTCRNCSTTPKEKPCISSQNINILLESLMEKIRVRCYHEDLGEGNKPSTRSLSTQKERRHRSFVQSLNPYLLFLETGEYEWLQYA